MGNIVRVRVAKQMDGLTFSILPSTQKSIKDLIPTAKPVDRIFVAYDTKDDFGSYYGSLEKWIIPALLGVSTLGELKKINEIEIFDSQTRQTLHRITVHDEEIQSILG